MIVDLSAARLEIHTASKLKVNLRKGNLRSLKMIEFYMSVRKKLRDDAPAGHLLRPLPSEDDDATNPEAVSLPPEFDFKLFPLFSLTIEKQRMFVV